MGETQSEGEVAVSEDEMGTPAPRGDDVADSEDPRQLFAKMLLQEAATSSSVTRILNLLEKECVDAVNRETRVMRGLQLVTRKMVALEE